MKQTFILLILFCVFSVTSRSQNTNEEAVFGSFKEMVTATKKEVVLISISDFHKMYTKSLSAGGTNFTLIDVRTETEYEDGFIPGAFLVQRGVLESHMEKDAIWEDFNYSKPSKSDTIILYCRSGSRSALAAKSLKMLGYTNIKSLEGGWSGWNEKYPNLKKIN